MSGEMSRGEMIRRLDEVSKQVHDQLENGPLTAEERHALATSLGGFCPWWRTACRTRRICTPRKLCNTKVNPHAPDG